MGLLAVSLAGFLFGCSPAPLDASRPFSQDVTRGVLLRGVTVPTLSDYIVPGSWGLAGLTFWSPRDYPTATVSLLLNDTPHWQVPAHLRRGRTVDVWIPFPAWAPNDSLAFTVRSGGRILAGGHLDLSPRGRSAPGESHPGMEGGGYPAMPGGYPGMNKGAPPWQVYPGMTGGAPASQGYPPPPNLAPPHAAPGNRTAANQPQYLAIGDGQGVYPAMPARFMAPLAEHPETLDRVRAIVVPAWESPEKWRQNSGLLRWTAAGGLLVLETEGPRRWAPYGAGAIVQMEEIPLPSQVDRMVLGLGPSLLWDREPVLGPNRAPVPPPSLSPMIEDTSGVQHHSALEVASQPRGDRELRGANPGDSARWIDGPRGHLADPNLSPALFPETWPPLSILIPAAAAYLLLLPGGFLLLAKLRRRELSWLAIPVLSVLFGGAVWGILLLSKGTRTVVVRQSVIEQVSPGIYSGLGYAVIFSPRRADFTLRAPAGMLVDWPGNLPDWTDVVHPGVLPIGGSAVLTVGSETTVSAVPVAPWSSTAIRYRFWPQISGSIQGSVRRAGGGFWNVTLQNTTGLTLENGWVWCSDGWLRAAPVPRGVTTLNLSPEGVDPNGFLLPREGSEAGNTYAACVVAHAALPAPRVVVESGAEYRDETVVVAPLNNLTPERDLPVAAVLHSSWGPPSNSPGETPTPAALFSVTIPDGPARERPITVYVGYGSPGSAPGAVRIWQGSLRRWVPLGRLGSGVRMRLAHPALYLGPVLEGASGAPKRIYLEVYGSTGADLEAVARPSGTLEVGGHERKGVLP